MVQLYSEDDGKYRFIYKHSWNHYSNLLLRKSTIMSSTAFWRTWLIIFLCGGSALQGPPLKPLRTFQAAPHQHHLVVKFRPSADQKYQFFHFCTTCWEPIISRSGLSFRAHCSKVDFSSRTISCGISFPQMTTNNLFSLQLGREARFWVQFFSGAFYLLYLLQAYSSHNH